MRKTGMGCVEILPFCLREAVPDLSGTDGLDFFTHPRPAPPGASDLRCDFSDKIEKGEQGISEIQN